MARLASYTLLRWCRDRFVPGFSRWAHSSGTVEHPWTGDNPERPFAGGSPGREARGEAEEEPGAGHAQGLRHDGHVVEADGAPREAEPARVDPEVEEVRAKAQGEPPSEGVWPGISPKAMVTWGSR